MKHLLLFSLALALLFFSGCASTTSRLDSQTRISHETFKEQPITKVDVTSSDSVKGKKTLKFNEDSLAQFIRLALENEGVFTPSFSKGYSLRVNVENIRIRSTFNAVMWGAMAGSDKIEGKVQLLNDLGQIIDEFKVSASYALGGIAGGQDGMRIEWLYEAFAKEIAKEFTEQ